MLPQVKVDRSGNLRILSKQERFGEKIISLSVWELCLTKALGMENARLCFMAAWCLRSKNKLIKNSSRLYERERCMAIFLNDADVRRNHLLQMLVFVFYLLRPLETGPE